MGWRPTLRGPRTLLGGLRSLGRVCTSALRSVPKLFTPSLAVVISGLALLVSGINLYLSQLRHVSDLSAFVSGLRIIIDNQQAFDSGIQYERTVYLKLALTNTGTAASSLLNIFLIVPGQLATSHFECSSAHIAPPLETLSSEFFSIRGEFQGIAFTMSPVVVPPGGIVVLDTTIPRRQVTRPSDQFGDKLLCLFFMAMNNVGVVQTTVFPAYTLGMYKDSAGTSERHPRLSRPIDLLKRG